MLPMLELSARLLRMSEKDSAEIARTKISRMLLGMNESYREDLPVIYDLFGVPDLANPSPQADADQRRRQLNSIVKRVLHDPGYRSGGPRVILLEDLHWFDGASNAFLETMVEAMPATRDLLLVNFRPDYHAPWMGGSYYQHVTLQPLGSDAIRGLLREYLGTDPSVAALPGINSGAHQRQPVLHRGGPAIAHRTGSSDRRPGSLSVDRATGGAPGSRERSIFAGIAHRPAG